MASAARCADPSAIVPAASGDGKEATRLLVRLAAAGAVVALEKPRGTLALEAAAVISREQLQTQRAAILATAARHGASNVRVFGSVARGEPTSNSDVDLLIDLEPGRSLFDLGALAADLEDLLGCPVDVAIARSLRPRVREHALRDAVPL